MFRPIKNFINYIQKNASSSAIFGSSTTIATDTETEPVADEIGIEATQLGGISKTKKVTSKVGARSFEERIITKITPERGRENGNEYANSKMKRIQANKLSNVDDTSAQTISMANGGLETNGCGGLAGYSNAEEEEVIDFELQIKSSVMVRPPLKPNANTHAVENLTDEVDVDVDTDADVDANGSLLLDRSDLDSQDEYEIYPHNAGEDTNTEQEEEEELITEGEESFLGLTNEREQGFQDDEIIVLNEPELNASLASDAPSEDPLAIDDLTQPSLLSIKDTSNTLDSSTNDEASTSTDLIWSVVEHVSTKSIIKTANIEKDLDIQKQDSTTTARSTAAQKPAAVGDKEDKTKSTNANSTTACTVLSTHSDAEHVEELRSDGSDSGLGSETSTLQNTLVSLTDTSQLATPSDNSAANTPDVQKTKMIGNDFGNRNSGKSCIDSAAGFTDSVVATTSSTPTAIANVSVPQTAVTAALSPLRTNTKVVKPLRSNLKRRLDDDDDVDMLVDPTHSQSTQLCAVGDGTVVKKPKRSINFDNVQVYYFPRQQGFGCVPSAGGCTLGMGARHIGFKTLTLAEHAAELRRAHRLQLQDVNPRGSSSDESEESEEDYLSEGSGSDLDAESNGFLQPVSPKQRRALLKAAGVRKIDAAEKIECRDIRNSREICGCTCVEFCDPETCACSQAGIKCQVDRAMFPCGCTRDACGNIAGRVEFNPTRVRTHFIHTIMRLEMENRQQQNPPLCSTMSSYSLSAACAASSTVVGGGGMVGAGVDVGIHAGGGVMPSTPAYANTLPASSYYSMQTQSNYSSGYASPAYPNEPAANYYQQQGVGGGGGGVGVGTSISAHSTTTHFCAVSTTELQTSAQQGYHLDTLDGDGLFTGTAAASTPVYGEIVPSYGSSSSSTMGVSASTATVNAYHQNINYAAMQQTQVATYTAYQQTTTNTDYLSQHNQQSAASTVAVATAMPPTLPPTTYSSCAVPSLPPYGTATTTAAAAEYQDSNYALVDTTAPSCIAMEDSGGAVGVVGVVGVGVAVDVGVGENNCANMRNNGGVGITTAVSGGCSDNSGSELDGVRALSGVSGCSSISHTVTSNANANNSNFIQLSTPVASATRLSQINDLLQHNRRTTATLVAVSHTTTTCLSVNSSSSGSGSVDEPLPNISNRTVTTDCDYNDSSNSLQDFDESKKLDGGGGGEGFEGEGGLEGPEGEGREGLEAERGGGLEGEREGIGGLEGGEGIAEQWKQTDVLKADDKQDKEQNQIVLTEKRLNETPKKVIEQHTAATEGKPPPAPNVERTAHKQQNMSESSNDGAVQNNNVNTATAIGEDNTAAADGSPTAVDSKETCKAAASTNADIATATAMTDDDDDTAAAAIRHSAYVNSN